MAIELPPLPYDYNALEPYIDEQTMRIHHTKHHATYVAKANEALANHPQLASRDVDDLLRSLSTLPDSVRTAVNNHGGGHSNHAIFWAVMGPKSGGNPDGKLAQAIDGEFGGFQTFKEKFTAAAVGQFGSGWAWLSMDGAGKLQVKGWANQDSPYTQGYTPLLGLDVWEHAYYLKYQNRRPEYVAAFWNVVNWKAVAERLAAARK
jgi:superoxide dismutase, Fe-Mn family